MAEPSDMILPLLREMRAEMNRQLNALDSKVEGRFDKVEVRLDGIDKQIASLKQAMLGESVLGRYATAEFEERLVAIERRIEALESRR